MVSNGAPILPESAAQRGHRGKLIAGIVALLIIAVGLFLMVRTREDVLHGLLIDLELGPADPSRHTVLRDVLANKLTGNLPELRDVRVTLDCVHFTALDVADTRPDFVILSPQGTPWHMYTGDSAAALDGLKRSLHGWIMSDNVPVLGICGGHQFLALAFGGAVGFIDPRFTDRRPERYSPDVISERGVVSIETLGQDPIFSGLVQHPGRFCAVQNHYEEIKVVPYPFVNLARSAKSEVQIMRVPGKTVYGVAFHPERGWDDPLQPVAACEHGRRILGNFLIMARHDKARFSKGLPWTR